MLYLNLKQGLLRVVVLETRNVEEILKGRPAVTADGSVVVAWTPDPAWLGAQLKTARNAGEVGNLIDEATRRPQQPVPAYFPAEEHMLTGMSGALPADYSAPVKALLALWPTNGPTPDGAAFAAYVWDTFIPAVRAIHDATPAGG